MHIGSELKTNQTTERNRETNLALLKAIREVSAKTKEGGGTKAIEKLHGKGKTLSTRTYPAFNRL